MYLLLICLWHICLNSFKYLGLTSEKQLLESIAKMATKWTDFIKGGL